MRRLRSSSVVVVPAHHARSLAGCITIARIVLTIEMAAAMVAPLAGICPDRPAMIAAVASDP
jgi:hypothetical protein